jgi:hypothetical protein
MTMFRIFADSFRIATRNDGWDAPGHWADRRDRPATDQHARSRDQRLRHRFFRDVGRL